MGRNRRYRYDDLPRFKPEPRKELPSYEAGRIKLLLTKLLDAIRPGDEVDLDRLGRVYDGVRMGYIRCDDVWWLKGLLERYGIG